MAKRKTKRAKAKRRMKQRANKHYTFNACEFDLSHLAYDVPCDFGLESLMPDSFLLLTPKQQITYQQMMLRIMENVAHDLYHGLEDGSHGSV